MKHSLVITCELDVEGNVLPYAMEIVASGLGYVYTASEFVDAKLDGNLLVSHDGQAPDSVKSLFHYQKILRTIQEDEE